MAPRQIPVVVGFGLKPERLVGAEGRIDTVPETPSAGLLLDALQSGIEAGGSVIAIVPEWFAPEGLQRLEMARTIVDTARVAIHVTPLPPLAATALASVASSLAPRLPSAGLLASALRSLEQELHHVTWLANVHGLKHPAPSLGQQMASLTPGQRLRGLQLPGAGGPPHPGGSRVDSAAGPGAAEPPDRRAAPRRRALDRRDRQPAARQPAAGPRRRDAGRRGLLGHGQARRRPSSALPTPTVSRAK